MCGLTLVGGMLRAVRGDEVEWHMRCAIPSGPLVTSTNHPLADKVSTTNDKDKQDDGNDWTNSVGASVRDATRGRRHILYTWNRKLKE